MEYWYLISAASLSFIGAIIHGVAGGKIYLGNINEATLTPLTKSLSLVAWHVFTIFLLVGAATFAAVAHDPDLAIAAYPVIAVNLLGAALFIVLSLGSHRHLIKMPGAYLMGGTALLAWLGL